MKKSLLLMLLIPICALGAPKRTQTTAPPARYAAEINCHRSLTSEYTHAFGETGTGSEPEITRLTHWHLDEGSSEFILVPEPGSNQYLLLFTNASAYRAKIAFPKENAAHVPLGEPNLRYDISFNRRLYSHLNLSLLKLGTNWVEFAQIVDHSPKHHDQVVGISLTPQIDLTPKPAQDLRAQLLTLLQSSVQEEASQMNTPPGPNPFESYQKARFRRELAKSLDACESVPYMASYIQSVRAALKIPHTPAPRPTKKPRSK